MKLMHKKILLLVVLGLILSVPVLAQLDPNVFNPNTNSAAEQAGYDTSGYADALPVIIGRIIKALLVFVSTIFLALVIYGGFLWMTAGGSKDQVTKAIDFIKNGAIGVFVIAIAYSIVSTVVYIVMRGVYGWQWF